MKMNMALTKDKRGLQVTVVLPERSLATDSIVVKSRREIVEIVKKEYPEFVYVSGPRKVTNNTNDTLTATWAFEMPPKETQPTNSQKPVAQKKTTTRKRKATSSENKA